MKIKISLATIIINLFFLSNCVDQFIEKFKNEVDKISIKLPEDYLKYVKNIGTSAKLRKEKFQADQLESKLDELGIHGSHREKLKGIVFSAEVTFDSFSFEITKSVGVFENSMGLASKKNNEIELILLLTVAKGETIPQRGYFFITDCSSILFFKYMCLKNKVSAPRGFMPSEVKLIEETLRNYSFSAVREYLDGYSSYDLRFLAAEASNTENRAKYIDEAIQFYFDKEKADKYVHSVFKAQNFQENIKIIRHHCVTKSNGRKTIEASPELDDKLKKVILSQIETDVSQCQSSDYHNIFRFVTNNIRGPLIFIEVFVHYSVDDEDFDIEIRKINFDFKLENKITLNKINNMISYYDEEAKEEYKGELGAVINLLELLSQKKSELL